MGIDIRQFNTTIEQFVGLKELYPMGNYVTSSSDQTCRTTWFEFTVPINNVTLEVTWFLEADKLSESVWTEMAEELGLI
tara:strand:- start:111 stop:347 length:237 start_codon:yes stop_codon:yes gene_type:complete